MDDMGGMFFWDEDDAAEMAETLGMSIEEARMHLGLAAPTNPDDPAWKTSEFNPANQKAKGRNAAMAELGIMPKQKTAWETIMEGTGDVRCQFRRHHAFNMLHALGINPNAPWPPSTDALFKLFQPREGFEFPDREDV